MHSSRIVKNISPIGKKQQPQINASKPKKKSVRRKINESHINKLAEPRMPIKLPAPEPKKPEPVKARSSSPPIFRKPVKSKFLDIKKKEDKPQDVRDAYEQKFGKSTKFIEHNSPIDRYYKMYVAEPETKVFQGLDSPRERNMKFKHFKGCPNGSLNSSPRLPSPER